jgi:uncharacterized protein
MMIAQRYQTGLNAPQDPRKAIDWFLMSAEAGHVVAQTMLGELSESGAGVQNFEEAARWYRKAAETWGPATSDLAHLYVIGKGVPQDYAEAAKLYRKATESDGLSGQYGLGFLYEQGFGLRQDPIRAMELYHEVAAIDDDAQRRLFALYEAKLPVPASQDEAIAWYRAAANADDPRAQVGLGLHYQFAKGVPRNWSVAYALYNLAARSSSPARRAIPDFTGPPRVAKIYMVPDTWDLVHEMATPGNLLKALDQFVDHPPHRHELIIP